MIQYLEEYCTEDAEGHLTKYRGSRLLAELPAGRQPGAQNGERLTLDKDLEIARGGAVRRPVLLKRGANSIQLCHEHGRWWIFSTVWDNEREGLSFDLW